MGVRSMLVSCKVSPTFVIDMTWITTVLISHHPSFASISLIAFRGTQFSRRINTVSPDKYPDPSRSNTSASTTAASSSQFVSYAATTPCTLISNQKR